MKLSELLGEADEDMTAGVTKLAQAVKSGYDEAKSKADKKKVELDKQSADAIKSFTISFLEDYFDNFPMATKSNGPEDIAKLIGNNRDRAIAVFKIFRDLAAQVESLHADMNRALTSSKRVSSQDITKFEATGRRITDAGKLPQQLIDFAKKESDFFKKLIQVDNDFQIKKADFKQLLSSKIKGTQDNRVADAAQALNILFSFMAADLNTFANIIADIGRRLKPEDDKK